MHSAHTQACRRACLAHDGGVAARGPLEKVPWESAGKRMPFARVALFARVVVVASFKAPLLHSLPPRSSIAPALVRMASDKSFRNPHNLPVKECVVCDRCPEHCHDSTSPPHLTPQHHGRSTAARPHRHYRHTEPRPAPAPEPGPLPDQAVHMAEEVGELLGRGSSRPSRTSAMRPFALQPASPRSPSCHPSACARSSAARSDASRSGRRVIGRRVWPAWKRRGARLPLLP